MKVSYEDLITLIPAKETGVITAKNLSEKLGCTETYIRKVINVARSNGVPICSTKYGYYYSDDYGDIAETVGFLTRRLRTQLQAIDGLIKIKRREDQT